MFVCLSSVGEIRDQEYVFLGEIVGYTGPIKSSRILRDAWGVKVKVEQSIQLPKTLNENEIIEVFSLGLTNACESTGLSKEDLQKYYPIGAKVRVAGMEGWLVDGTTTNSHIRLC